MGTKRAHSGFTLGIVLLLGTVGIGVSSPPLNASGAQLSASSDADGWSAGVIYELDGPLPYFYGDITVDGHTPVTDNDIYFAAHFQNGHLLIVSLDSLVPPSGCDSNGCKPGDTALKRASFFVSDDRALAGGRSDGGTCSNDFTPECQTPYNWIVGRTYRIIMRGEPESDSSTRLKWTISVVDRTNDKRTQIGTVVMPEGANFLDGTVRGWVNGRTSCHTAPYVDARFGQVSDGTVSRAPSLTSADCAGPYFASGCNTTSCSLRLNPERAFGFGGAKLVGFDASDASTGACTLGFAARKKIDGVYQEYWVAPYHCARDYWTRGTEWKARNFHLMHSSGPWLGSDVGSIPDWKHDAFAFATRRVLGTNRIRVSTSDGRERLMRITSVGRIGDVGDRKGDRVCTSGATTGIRKCGPILGKARSRTGVTERLVDITFAPGDSGGPVFRQTSATTVELVGLVSKKDMGEYRYTHARDILGNLGLQALVQ